MLVLAAGGSSRLGRPKQLVHFGSESLVRRAASLALSVGAPWVGVVVGARGMRIRAELRDLRVAVIANRRWRDGLSASLRAGLARVPRSAAYLLVLAVDQWRLETADLQALLRRAQPATAVAALYGGRAGVPAVFPRGWWSKLRCLTGDSGAAQLLRAIPVVTVAIERAALDLDERSDLRRLRAARTRSWR